MLLHVILASLSMATGTGPMDAALEATEAPDTLRAAFTVELRSQTARHVYSFDPRDPKGARWKLLMREGHDEELDAVAANWASEPAPDGRLFPDDLRACLGQTVQVNTEGHAWRVGFRHHPNYNDNEFDRWAAERLQANALLDPVGERFLQIDYTLPKAVNVPNGGKLTRYNQTYILSTEPRWGFSYVSGFAIDLEARAAFKRITRSYQAEVTDVQFFFASPEAERAFLDRQAQITEVSLPTGFGAPLR
ncbi:hypothetical protein HNE_2727 [Hyphomonas neptunium ATCC 15444]|uniref:Uncharacterized protein n=2 Tax=Hyphomonas TaxID=85 RepID=Q0BYN6_HYPNA|nr:MULTISPECIES: hypothetical protein [Hyphomonas]ABI77346.1 hypothetical protein HNE_2727 [Hyphomonas neptunium ATCC 15444]KCZ91534.1 hypothetical protein HHI_13119 [Hyphomonas hirschiana VP5]